jgi:hypothetical protein
MATEEAITARTVTAQINPPTATATKRMETEMRTLTATDIPQTVTGFTNIQFLVIYQPLMTNPLMEMDSRNPKGKKKLATQMVTVMELSTEVTRGISRPLKRLFHLQHRLAQLLLRLPRKVRSNYLTLTHTDFQLQQEGHEEYKNLVTSNKI